MFSVALIGPDGVGKTTIARQVEQTAPMPMKYLYMGVDLHSSNHMLPTSRLIHWIKTARGVQKDTAGPQDSRKAPVRPQGVLRRALHTAKVYLGLSNRLAEQWYRQALASYYRRRGYVVLFDRHYFPDFYAYDIAPDGRSRPLHRRIHGFFLARLYPRPDLTIYLDAPAEVLLARKGEGTVEALMQRRHEYLQMREHLEHFAVVIADRSQEEVCDEVMQRIEQFYRQQTGKSYKVSDGAKQTV